MKLHIEIVNQRYVDKTIVSLARQGYKVSVFSNGDDNEIDYIEIDVPEHELIKE